MIGRRAFCLLPASAALAAPPAPAVVLPVVQIVDRRARWRPAQIGNFWSRMWPEAVRDFAASGVRLEGRLAEGEVGRTPGDRPIFRGAVPGALNLITTDAIPLLWDHGRGLAGVTTRYDGCDLCVIALNYAHCNQVPWLSVNTCVHELLHALLGDIGHVHPEGVAGAEREFRIDWQATAMWLFHGTAEVREAAARRAGGGKRGGLPFTRRGAEKSYAEEDVKKF